MLLLFFFCFKFCAKSLNTEAPVHTATGKLENAALFRRLSLPSTPVRHENGAFRKHSSNWRNLKTPALRFSVDGKHFDNGAFENP